MKDDELKIVRSVLTYLKVARQTDPPTCTALMLGDECKKYIKLLERVCDWTPKDEEEMKLLAKETNGNTKGKPLGERSHQIAKRMWKVFFGTAALGVMFAGIKIFGNHKEEDKGGMTKHKEQSTK